MKTPAAAIVAFVLLASSAVAAPAPPRDDIIAPIHKFIDAFNKGEDVSSLFVDGDIAIVDEFAPNVWIGRNAMSAWGADFESHAKATGLTGPAVTLGKTVRSEVSGDRGYAVVQAVYSYKEHGKAMAEDGQMTFAMKKEAGGWRIGAWTWTGPKPHPAK
jgi:hypothetical protein